MEVHRNRVVPITKTAALLIWILMGTAVFSYAGVEDSNIVGAPPNVVDAFASLVGRLKDTDGKAFGWKNIIPYKIGRESFETVVINEKNREKYREKFSKDDMGLDITNICGNGYVCYRYKFFHDAPDMKEAQKQTKKCYAKQKILANPSESNGNKQQLENKITVFLCTKEDGFGFREKVFSDTGSINTMEIDSPTGFLGGFFNFGSNQKAR